LNASKNLTLSACATNVKTSPPLFAPIAGADDASRMHDNLMPRSDGMAAREKRRLRRGLLGY